MGRVHSTWLLGLCFIALNSWAQESEQAAHEVVNKTTQQVMAVVAEADAYADEDPERYYQQVQEILDPVIDFRGFARSVMGPYASSARYRSLDEAGREKLRGQLDDFTEVMRVGLVRTYSKGLLAYGDSRIEVFAAAEEHAESGRAAVRQLVYTGQPDPFVLVYYMGLSKTGEWLLRNIVIEGVNLGEIYRSQFEASAREYDGDLDAVIGNWTTVEVDTQET
ncbi:MAG: ABC transporter substrate-binding protein [Pseudomonadota bacterium]